MNKTLARLLFSLLGVGAVAGSAHAIECAIQYPVWDWADNGIPEITHWTADWYDVGSLQECVGISVDYACGYGWGNNYFASEGDRDIDGGTWADDCGGGWVWGS